MADIIYDRTWSIEDGFVRCFILEGNDKALMIDTGVSGNAFEMAKSVTSKPIKLINTHSDRDHVSDNAKFISCYMHEADVYNYRSQGFNNKIVNVSDGQITDLGDRPVKIIHIPGHTDGSIAILDINNRVLYAGDSVQDSDIFMFGDRRNITEYAKSLNRLLEMSDEFDCIYASHGTLKVGKEKIKQLIDATSEIRAGKATGNPVDMFGNQVMLYKYDFAGLLCDMPDSIK